jgi:hypothetical protein
VRFCDNNARLSSVFVGREGTMTSLFGNLCLIEKIFCEVFPPVRIRIVRILKGFYEASVQKVRTYVKQLNFRIFLKKLSVFFVLKIIVYVKIIRKTYEFYAKPLTMYERYFKILLATLIFINAINVKRF